MAPGVWDFPGDRPLVLEYQFLLGFDDLVLVENDVHVLLHVCPHGLNPPLKTPILPLSSFHPRASNRLRPARDSSIA